jgi:membrane protease YdiL (CAAX protease family)
MQIAAVVLGVGPLYAGVFYSGYISLQTGDFTLDAAALAAGVLVMASFAIFLIGLLMLLGERVSDLDLKPGALGNDIRAGIGLTLLILLVLFGLRQLQMLLEQLQLIPPTPDIPESNLELVGSLAGNPLLLGLFFGPVIWVQAALVEELTRVFVLTRLWKVWPARSARVLCVLMWSVIFGIAHIYQGAVGVVGTALIGLVLGTHYMLRGRVLPLVIAHGLYDTLATLALLYAVQHPELFAALL